MTGAVTIEMTAPALALEFPAETPIVPSPFKSWWKLVSSDSNAEFVPDTTRTRFEV